MNRDKQMMEYKWGAQIWATLILAWPIILSNLSQMLINSTDVLLLGRVGPQALAASAIGVGIVITPLVVGIGIISASSPMIAKQLGHFAHSVREVRRTVRASMWVAIIFSIPIMVLLWFTGDIVAATGLNPQLARDVGIFVRALEFEIPFVLLTVSLRNFVAALHRPIWSMAISIIAVFVNAILNYGLILGHFGLPALGLLGAGIGSSIVCFLTFLGMAIVVSFERKFRRYYIFGRFWRADFSRLKKLFALGLPIGAQIGFEVSVFSAAVYLMGFISTNATAAHAIAIQIASLTFMVPMGIAQAATIRVGNALGRKDEIGIKYAGWAAFIMAVGFMALVAAPMFIFPRELALLFVEKDNINNEAVILIAIGFIKIAAIFQIADGAQVVGAGMLRGLHDTKWPMIFAGIGYWIIGIGAGALLAFKFNMGGNGIWFGLAIGLAAVAIMMIIRWLARDKLGLISKA